MTAAQPRGPISVPLPPPPGPWMDRRALRAQTLGHTAVVLTGLGGLLVAGRALDLHAPSCPFRSITGIACPGCGMTRLAAALARGDVGLALTRDPAGATFLAALVIVAVASGRFVLRNQGRPPSWVGSRFLAAGLIGLLVAHWVTTLVWGGMLPV